MQPSSQSSLRTSVRQGAPEKLTNRTDINDRRFYEGIGSGIKWLARLRSVDGVAGWKLRQQKMLQPWGRIPSFPETSSFAGRPPTAWRSLTRHIPGTGCTAWAELNVPRWMNTCWFWASELLPHFLQMNRAAVDTRVRVCVEASLLWNLWTVPGGLRICRSFQLPCVRAPVLLASPYCPHCPPTGQALFYDKRAAVLGKLGLRTGSSGW